MNKALKQVNPRHTCYSNQICHLIHLIMKRWKSTAIFKMKEKRKIISFSSILNTERAYKWRLSGSARQSQFEYSALIGLFTQVCRTPAWVHSLRDSNRSSQRTTCRGQDSVYKVHYYKSNLSADRR